MSLPLYETDFYTWALRQSDKLRAHDRDLDWDNLAEEIEALSRAEARELRSRYILLLTQLLKWLFQPERRGASWEVTIKRERKEIEDHLNANPGLKSRRDELFGEAYAIARLDAALETDLAEATFPETNPFTVAQAMDEAFWPEA